jgi:DNA-3-methyladenine glycosylase II
MSMSAEKFTTAAFAPSGPFSLAASVRFLDGFTPASNQDAGDGTLRMAFPSDDGRSAVAAAMRQDQAAAGAAGTVRAEYTVHPGSPGLAVEAQLARILSLDVDGTGFPALAAADPVVARLMAEFPGLRPVCFYSPYEAAAWTIIGQRIRMTQAAAIKASLAEQHGERVQVAAHTLYAFPSPHALRAINRVPGLSDLKLERLHALAEAADAGELDAARLRARPADDALAALRTLPGIGPFSAELILIRGAGHPDIFPSQERRLHAAMAQRYDLGESASDVDQLGAIAEGWKPYRSWVGLLLRAGAS